MNQDRTDNPEVRDNDSLELPFVGCLDEFEDRMRDLDLTARKFVRENPTLAVAGAVALGFVLGKVFR